MFKGALKLARSSKGLVIDGSDKWSPSERQASFLRCWCPMHLPGLFQVDDYALPLFPVEQSAINPGWRKSSGNGGGNCFEVGALPWRRSTPSGNGGGNCVEAAHAPGAVLVRDTQQHGTGPVLRVSPTDWERLTSVIRGQA